MGPPSEKSVIGLMSGTSLDGIDAALIVTDGLSVSSRSAFVHIPYGDDFRARLREGMARATEAKTKVKDDFFKGLEADLTEAHAGAVRDCLAEAGLAAVDLDLIGFHGQTLFHAPAQKFTWQLGDGALLARLTGIDVVGDFRSNDIKNGGQGAPFLPLYHQALFRDMAAKTPVAVLNIGGVANVTWIHGDDILAFDTGPGNALMDDWIMAKAGKPFDDGGKLAARGSLNDKILKAWINHPYFCEEPPKALDRCGWPLDNLEKLSLEDGLATLSAFTLGAILKAANHFPSAAGTWIVSGGGRHNAHLMDQLKTFLKVPVVPIEDFGLNGDALEAEGFAYLAARSAAGLPLSIPTTTGVKEPSKGGVLFKGS